MQNFFDPVLARFAKETKHADIRYSHAHKSFIDHGGHVAATVVDEVSGAEKQVRALPLGLRRRRGRQHPVAGRKSTLDLFGRSAARVDRRAHELAEA